MKRVLLVGNPNCGKTTLFNALTGDRQRVGNWPGVTVEKKIGAFCLGEHTVQVVDLPGLYSLTLSQESASLDEKITAEVLIEQGTDADVIVNVIDACQLERHLYLTTQLLELGKPLIMVLNMTDIAQQRRIHIEPDALSRALGCAVVLMQAHRASGLAELQQALIDTAEKSPEPHTLPLPSSLQHILQDIAQHWVNKGVYTPSQALYFAHRFLEGDTVVVRVPECPVALPDEADILVADARYQAVHDMVLAVQTKHSDTSEYLTEKIDRIVLHRFWGIPIFLGLMYCMFFFSINLGGALQDFFDIGSEALFVQGTRTVLQAIQAPNWVIAILADGVGKGVNVTCTFIPVIAAMFFFLAWLETSGYMARAAFIVDKVMRMLGLPGKSFVPMIVGFGCNVPAIMAARTLDSERDRLLTVLMSPFMSCSARLAIYAVFVAAFFPLGGHNVVFSLYFVGIGMAILTGLLLRKSVFHGSVSPLLLELPAYHQPSLARLLKETAFRLRYFMIRAGKFIIPASVLIGGCNAMVWSASGDSILAVLGQWITPFFAPMGMHPENWPAAMGLLTGVLAKEVVVGTLHTLYAGMGHVGVDNMAGGHFLASMQAALFSIPQNLSALTHVFFHPWALPIAQAHLPSAINAMMVSHFSGKVGAYAYLLFVLLYMPCVSTMAVIRQEAGRRLMWFSIVWSFVLAYGLSVGFYQVATFDVHPAQTVSWIVMLGGSLGVAIFVIRLFLFQQRKLYVTAAS